MSFSFCMNLTVCFGWRGKKVTQSFRLLQLQTQAHNSTLIHCSFCLHTSLSHHTDTLSLPQLLLPLGYFFPIRFYMSLSACYNLFFFFLLMFFFAAIPFFLFCPSCGEEALRGGLCCVFLRRSITYHGLWSLTFAPLNKVILSLSLPLQDGGTRGRRSAMEADLKMKK